MELELTTKQQSALFKVLEDVVWMGTVKMDQYSGEEFATLWELLETLRTKLTPPLEV